MGGTSYSQDGSMAGQIAADLRDSPLYGNPLVIAAASAACGSPIVNSLKPDSFRVDDSLHALYGNYDVQSHSSLWRDIAVPDRPELANFRQISQGAAKVVFDGGYSERGVDKHFVIYATVPLGEKFDCHVCSPLLSSAVFARRGAEWHIESEEKYLTLGASYGERPRCQLVKLGPDRFGVAMYYSDMAQGFEVEWIVFVAAEGSTIKPVLTLTTRQDPNDELCRGSSNPESCTHYIVEYQFVPGSDPTHFDIQATKKISSGPKTNTVSTERFSFVGDRYISSGMSAH
jgi:hypothetical protein